MADLKPSERIQLQRLINESECEDNTESIRRLKHSVLIRDDIRKIDTLRNTELDDKNSPAFRSKCIEQCPFLFNNYTELFNKMIKGELDLTIMTKLLTVLKLIEDDKVDQHEGNALDGSAAFRVIEIEKKSGARFLLGAPDALSLYDRL